MEQHLSLLKKEKCQAVSHHIAFKNLQLAVSEKHNTVDDVDLSEENENDSCDDADDEEEEDTVLNFVDEESETDKSDTEPEQDGGTQEENFNDANMMEVVHKNIWCSRTWGIPERVQGN